MRTAGISPDRAQWELFHQVLQSSSASSQEFRETIPLPKEKIFIHSCARPLLRRTLTAPPFAQLRILEPRWSTCSRETGPAFSRPSCRLTCPFRRRSPPSRATSTRLDGRSFRQCFQQAASSAGLFRRLSALRRCSKLTSKRALASRCPSFHPPGRAPPSRAAE